MARFNGKRGHFARFSAILEAVIPTSVPGQISYITGTNVPGRPYGNGAVALSWPKRPRSEGVTSYNVYYYDGHLLSYLTSTSTNSITLTNVGLGANVFMVKAVNIIGEGQEQNTDYIFVSTVPDAPTMSITPADQSLSITLTGETGADPINYWEVYVQELGRTVQGESSTITVDNLVNDTTYTLKARAINDNGSSQWSATQTAIPSAVQYATVLGGTLTSDATHYYRTFTSSDYLTVLDKSLTFDAFVVAGGGSGALYAGGGGGGGGTKLFENLTSNPGANYILVGSGAPGPIRYGNVFGPAGNNGSSSIIFDSNWNLLANTEGGGGGGVYYTHLNGLDGGNGGGGGLSFDAQSFGGSSTTNYGHSGGNGTVVVNYGNGVAGGGAGASQDGGTGDGGAGYYLPEYANPTGTGINGYFAGGGGGGGRGVSGGLGGLGGGTNGTTNYPQSNTDNAPQNTGGGSGGAGSSQLYSYNGNGGSGIVIIRYTKSQVEEPQPRATVSGGTLYSDATHYYRLFTASDMITVANKDLTADVLLVAGGGSSGSWNGANWEMPGGGGGGGVLGLYGQTIPASQYICTVGAGGGQNYMGQGINGTNTKLIDANSLTTLFNAVGGGGGSGYGAGNDGGSGGGGPGYARYPGGHGVPGQGNDGGTGTFNYWSGGSGGGGAGEAGHPAPSNNGGQGGNGTNAFADIIGPTVFGQSMEPGYVGGGGGGSRSYVGGGNGSGGLGGGGGTYSGMGWENTGGGGMGSDSYYGMPGGSGVFVLRYAKSEVE